MTAITDATSLINAVTDYLARSDLSSYIANFIQNAEMKVYRTVNARGDLTPFSISVADGKGVLPDNYKGLKHAYGTGAPTLPLEWVNLEDLYRDYPVRTNAGTPKVISTDGINFVFGPAPSDFTLEGFYYRKQKSYITSIPTDNTGDTTSGSATISGMTDTSDFVVGEPVTVSAGFTTAQHHILSTTSTTVTLSTSATSTETNVTVAGVESWYVVNAPDVLLYGALLEAAAFLRDDPRLPVWKQLFDEAVDTVEKEAAAADTSLGNLRVRAA